MNWTDHRRIQRGMISALLALGLAACGGGGGGNAGSPVGTTPGSVPTEASTPAKIDLSAAADAVPSAATGAIAITAVVKNKDNSSLPAQAIKFAASSGALVSVPTTTDVNGVVKVSLTPGSDRSNRTIVVTATAGTAVSTINVPVTGTTVALSGSGSLLLSAGNVSYSAKVLDSAGAAVAGASLTFVSSLGNTITPATAVTDSSGFAQVTYLPVSAGIDTLSVSGLGTSARLSVSISGQNFSFVNPASGGTLTTSTAQPVRVQVANGNVGLAGQTVTFSSTRGSVTPNSTITDETGSATVSVFSATAGPATLTATLSSGATATQQVEFVAVTPARIVLQANPSAVLPNASGATTSRSTLSAVVRDIIGNPVKNATVNFSAEDPSAGSISPATGITDSNGQVQSSFIAGAASTATNGVTVTATLAKDTSITSSAKVTVNGRALFITVGTGNQIEAPNATTYSKPFSVYVTDSNGSAVVAQPVVLSVSSEGYAKGRYNVLGTAWVRNPTAVCANEDRIPRNGILDLGEDTNGDGRLTPGNVAVVSTVTVVTDATGFAAFNLLYGKQYATWVSVAIKASANVAGTESSAQYGAFALPVLAEDLSSSTVSPPNVLSPFGLSSACTDAQ